MLFSVYMPAYQVRQELEETIRRIPATAWKCIKALHILDDGSSDGTAEIAQKLSAEFTQIQVHRACQNQGYGNTVRYGIQLCLQDQVSWMVCLHADGQYAPEMLLDLVKEAQGRKLALLQGSRHAQKQALQGGMPLYKWLAGKILVALENRIFHLQLTDYHSGYLVLHVPWLHQVNWQKLDGRFELDLQLIATAVAKKLPVGECPIPTRYAGEQSHLNPWTYGLRVLHVLWKFRQGYYGT